jgi:hypothetical protein
MPSRHILGKDPFVVLFSILSPGADVPNCMAFANGSALSWSTGLGISGKSSLKSAVLLLQGPLQWLIHLEILLELMVIYHIGFHICPCHDVNNN